MTRKPTLNLERLEAATSDDKPIGIPPGARVRVDFDTPVDTSTLINNSHYPNELAELAASQLEDDIPIDPITEFCSSNAPYAGCTMRVTRLADPAGRRIPGQTYNRQCLEIESLGDTPFDPANLQGTLQLINGNSGGVFRLWLIDDDTNKPFAFLNRIAVNDPPKQYNPATPTQSYYQQQPPTPTPPSALELRMQDLQEKLLSNALARLLEPPPQPQLPPTSTISDEDRLTLLLVKEGGLLTNVVGKITALVGSPDTVGTKQTWSDWLKDTGGELLRTNPEIGERITNTLANVVTLVLDRLPGKQQPQPQSSTQSPPQQLQSYSGGRIEPLAPRAVVNTGLPEVPQSDEEEEEDYETLDQANDDVDLENDTMVVLEDLIGLLSGSEPLRNDHPVFIRLHTEYPIVFQQAISLIAQYPLESIILWVKSKGSLYANLLNGETTGPHLRKRLQELKDLANAPAPTQSEVSPNVEQQETQTRQGKSTQKTRSRKATS